MNKNRIILFLFSTIAALYLFSFRKEDTHSTRMLQTSGDITLPSSSFSVGGLQIYFDIDTTDITMAIKCTTPGVYFAIGFGSTGMAGSDIWVFTPSGGQILATDRYGAGYFVPSTDTSNGGTNDLTRLGYEITSSYSLVKVKRALNTGDSNDYALSEGNVDFIYAIGPSASLVYHSSRGYVQVPLRNGLNGVMLEDKEPFDRVDLHGILNIIAWGLLVDIAILAARYLRGTKLTILRITITAQVIHSALMWLTFILSTVMTVALLKRKGMDGLSLTGERKHDFHVRNGIAILALSSLAVAIGGINFYLMKNYQDKVGAKAVFYLKRAHLALGLLLYLLAKVNIIIGCIFHDEGKWKVPVYIYLGVLAAFHILFQFRYSSWLKAPETRNLSVKTHIKNQKHADLLEAINNGTPMEKLLTDFPKTKWVQLGNGIYDLTDWVHPGGNFIIEACIGREVGRYFYGNYSLEGTSRKPHKHSQLAFSQVQKFYIGEVFSRESVLVRKDTQQEGQATSSHSWKVVSMRSLSDTVSQISFTSEHFNVKSFGSSLSFLGRHFKVSLNRKGSRARQYTTALALTEANTELRQDIYNYFKSAMDKSEDSFFDNNSASYEDLTDNLSLFIKNYPFPKALSRSLHDIDIDGQGNDLIIEGPIGRGLELASNSSGTHAIICAGTGVLPFIDFLNVFLFKTMYQVLKEKIGEKAAEKVNVYKIPLDNMMEGLELKFIGAFANKKEIIGLDIIEKLAEISKKYKINNFDAVMRGYGDENIVQTKEYFSADFFRKQLDLTEEKYYIVGPPKMNAQVSKDLARLGVAADKIILV